MDDIMAGGWRPRAWAGWTGVDDEEAARTLIDLRRPSSVSAEEQDEVVPIVHMEVVRPQSGSKQPPGKVASDGDRRPVFHLSKIPKTQLLSTPPATPSSHGSTKSDSASPPPSKRRRLLSSSSRKSQSCGSESIPLSFEDLINVQQHSLLRDGRVENQLNWFYQVEDTKPATFYSDLAPTGIHILQHGSAAQTSTDAAAADFIVGDSKRLDRWLLEGTGDKMFVLRDQDWLYARPSLTGSSLFQELQARSLNKTLMLEVQELSKRIGDPNVNSVQPMNIDQILHRWAIRDHSTAPINLLNLMCKDDAYMPWPLAKHCNLLNLAAASSASIAQSAAYATAGKESTDVITKLIDLESCMHFQIFGQEGAISTWHMDAIGPYTYVTLEPNHDDERPEEVLKLWAFVRTDNLSEAEQAEIRADFQRDNGGFMPKAEHLRIISLIAGDTLIMPPGTIHAPITITDCLFRGGMVMQKRQMRRSMREWRFCMDNDRCTNENQPRQARSILDFFKREVYANPGACGYGEEGGIAEFEKDYTRLSGDCMICNCKGTCNTKKCPCQVNTQRCGSRCHKAGTGGAKCENPFGCEVEVPTMVQ